MTFFQVKSNLTGKSYKWKFIQVIFLFLVYLSIVNAFDAFFDFLLHKYLENSLGKHFCEWIQENY